MQQDLKSNLTQQTIINEAFNLFYANGFKSTSVDKVMKTTNLTKGAFYHHFKSKKELGIAVISQNIKQRVYDNMISTLNVQGEVITILQNTFINKLNSFSEFDKKHGCALNNLINEIGDTESSYQIALRQIIESWKTAVVDLLERGKIENTIKPDINCRATATHLISAFEGIRGIRKLYNDDQILNDYILGISSYINHLKK
jgi:AcrR family transcriptional regulator